MFGPRPDHQSQRLRIRGGRWQLVVVEWRVKECGRSDPREVDARRVPGERCGRTTGQESELRFREFGELPQSPNAGSAKLPSERRVDTREQFDFQGREESRLVSLENVNDATRTCELR